MSGDPPDRQALGIGASAGLAAGLVALGPLGLLLYTPALPLLERELGTTPAAAQLTVIVFYVGFTFAQLVHGPLSDAFGRRPVCLGATALFSLASVMAWLAPDIATLTVARVLQGLGAAVGAVLSRAIVRDMHEGEAMQRILNIMALILSCGPSLSPFVGGLLVDHVGWRHVFSFMALYGALLLAFLWLVLPETNMERSVSRARPARVLRQYRELVTAPRFILPTVVATLLTSVLYAIAGVLPYVFIGVMGMSPAAFGSWSLLPPLSFTLGSLLYGRIVRHARLASLIRAAVAVMTLAVLALPVLIYGHGPSALAVIAPLCVVMFATALITPLMWSVPLMPFGHAAGAAAALFGFTQYGMGLLGSALASLFPDPVTAVVVVPMMMVGGGAALWLLFWSKVVGRP